MLTQLATNPAGVVGDAGVSSFASSMQQGMGGPGGLESFAMSIIYPSLKPMLETSIRKLTVTVNWREGVQQRDITIVQYVTRPMKPPLLPSAAGSGTSPPPGVPGGPGAPGGPGFGGLGSQMPGGRTNSFGRAP
jgi:hypothetical protein